MDTVTFLKWFAKYCVFLITIASVGIKTCKDIWLPSFSVLRRTVLGEQIVSFQDLILKIMDLGFMSKFLQLMEVFVFSICNLFLISPFLCNNN